MPASDYNKIFRPELSPQEMLEAGVFGGNYFKNDVTDKKEKK